MHNVSSKNNDVNKMVIPAVLPKPKNFRLPTDDDDQLDDTPTLGSGMGMGMGGPGGRGVTFKLLSRDAKGRFETRQLLVPEDNKMAVTLAKSEEALRIEKQKLKERVLQIDKLTAEAEVSINHPYQSSLRNLLVTLLNCFCPFSSRLPKSAPSTCASVRLG